ncbi:MAG: FkbM family methyltransferase [Gomphosphaeria aponina SAG 52.96 = DSM 107014]|uniref:FkbM family methyltransferase n=1 Tax=Gomphosphaeria aponina SAG 52.96 = DSM 107014 TaxID=1521640 RepID=A0A941JP76_9CHRO|nr:FkbM family methyltransferase [Gomphosphaeria aponina SAG 52.96 = DSM 107014]
MSPIEYYWQYINEICPQINSDLFSRLVAENKDTEWDEPESSRDLNNFAVMALIEAEKTEDLSLRSLNLEMALEAFNRGVELANHPLCVAHLALVHSLIGARETATQMAFSIFLDVVHNAYNDSEKLQMGLVYLPPKKMGRSEQMQQLLQAEDGREQALLLLTEVMCSSQLVFYNAAGLRFLELAVKIAPNSVIVNLQLGISNLVNRRWEGLLYLQRARKLAPDYAPTVQALYLAYRQLNQTAITDFWYNIAREQDTNSLPWSWAKLQSDSPFSYLPFENDLLLTVESSFQSLVTSVLLAQGDWFEAEMELLRNQLEPGMTVIDVGANVGVYTFSAARKVGETGKVLAVEPFSGCVECLQETCRVNKLSWVKVCPGAASDRLSTARLALHNSSELNEVVMDESLESGNFATISCFTLDSLIEQENIKGVDWLKIDAEGHEMQVLLGSDRLLTEFAPSILYENIAAAKGSNTPVAEFLISRGYRLFRYQPYLQNLIPINSLEELQGNLNVIALPPTKIM